MLSDVGSGRGRGFWGRVFWTCESECSEYFGLRKFYEQHMRRNSLLYNCNNQFTKAIVKVFQAIET